MPFDPESWRGDGPPADPPEPKRPPKPEPPPTLAEDGRALWDDVVSGWRLRPDELRVLRGACSELDLVVRIEAEVAQRRTLRTTGSMGQEIADPLATEARLHWTTFRALIAQLRLPDDKPAGACDKGAMTVSENARRAARARWDNYRGGGA